MCDMNSLTLDLSRTDKTSYRWPVTVSALPNTWPEEHESIFISYRIYCLHTQQTETGSITEKKNKPFFVADVKQIL